MTTLTPTLLHALSLGGYQDPHVHKLYLAAARSVFCHV